MSKKVLKFIYLLLLTSNFIFFFLPVRVYAQTQPAVSCKFPYVDSAKFPKIWPHNEYLNAANNGAFEITFNKNSARRDWHYFIMLFEKDSPFIADDKRTDTQELGSNSVLTFEMNNTFDHKEEYYEVKLMHNEKQLSWAPNIGGLKNHSFEGDEEVCNLGTIYISHTDLKDTACQFTMPAQIQNGDTVSVYIPSVFPSTGDFTFAIIPNPPPQKINLTNTVQKSDNFQNQLSINGIDVSKIPGTVPTNLGSSNLNPDHPESIIVPGAVFWQSIQKPTPSLITIPFNKDKFTNQNYTAVVYNAKKEGISLSLPTIGGSIMNISGLTTLLYRYCAFFNFTVGNNPTDKFAGTSTPLLTSSDISKGEGVINRILCTEENPCSQAAGDSCDKNTGFKTAIGCIHTSPAAFVKDFLTFAVGIGGGLAFMMMLFGAFQMMTSGGNPQNLQGGRDVFQNAVIGLLFIIFSILLMKIIGIDILSLPGFSP